jgi:biopolymer transport protein TolQ
MVALLLQGQGDVSSAPSIRIVRLLIGTSWIQRTVLLLLVLFSVVSWGIILYKLWIFRRTSRQTDRFLDVFRRSSKFSEVQAVCRSLGESPLVGLFQSGYAELTAQLRQAAPPETKEPGAHPAAVSGRPTLKSLTAVDRALLRASVVEVNKLEKYVSFLATTASVAPFIGLFGTVWGIMTSFEGISQQGSSSIGVVAPGIAEALVATAAGLAAAIPAVIAYNAISHRVKLFASDMDDFSMEFLNIAERNFT